MDSWNYGESARNPWQGTQRYRGRGRGWQGQGPWNPTDNYNYSPRQHGGWRNHRPQQPYYREQNYRPHHHHRGGGFQPPYVNFPRTQLNRDNIENWISPKMWEDPWEDLMRQFEPSKKQNNTEMPTSPLEKYPVEEVSCHEPEITTDTSPINLQKDEGPTEGDSEESKSQNNSPAGNTETSQIESTPYSVTYEHLETLPE